MHLNVIQLAESLGVEESVIQGWVSREGLPAIEDRGRLVFDRAQVVLWAAERGLAAKAGFLTPDLSSANQGERLKTFLETGQIWHDIHPAEVLPTLERVVHSLPGCPPTVRQMMTQRLWSPGGINWAPVGSGFALPHLRAHVALGRDMGLLAFLLLSGTYALPDPPPDEVPVTRLLFFVAPSPRAHLELLAALSTALTRGSLRDVLQRGAPDKEIFAALSDFGRVPGKAAL